MWENWPKRPRIFPLPGRSGYRDRAEVSSPRHGGHDMAQASVAGKGLEGVTATTSAVSTIIGSTLTYRGYDINELAEHSSFEETIYLLWYGELPNEEQLEA